jgi:tetratricopeptide (TPR) repeat protein
MPKAKGAAETALGLDEALAEAHAALGYVHLVYDWDGPAAAKAPLSIRTHTLGTVNLLFARRYDEAIELARKGLELEPDSAFVMAFQGVAYAKQGRFQ